MRIAWRYCVSNWAYIETQPPSGLQPQATSMKPLAFPLVCLRDIVSTEHEHYALSQMEGVPFNCVGEAVSPHGLPHLAQHPHHLLEEGLMRAVPAASLNAIDSHCSGPKFSSLSQIVIWLWWLDKFCQFCPTFCGKDLLISFGHSQKSWPSYPWLMLSFF